MKTVDGQKLGFRILCNKNTTSLYVSATILDLQISVLIQFSAIWTAQNPSKNELHAEDEGGALATRHPMRITEPRGTATIPSRDHLNFQEIFGLNSLGSGYTVWEW